MKYLFVLVGLLFSIFLHAQNTLHAAFFGRMQKGSYLPEKVLATRSIVAYSHNMSVKELAAAQEQFKDIGIDAVAYYDLDVLLAGEDVGRALAFAFNKRDIDNLVFLYKDKVFKAYITQFNTKSTFVEMNQVTWMAENTALSELLKDIRRAAGTLKRENLLINDVPETDVPVDAISGRRSEFFAIDLKVDPLAVPMFGEDTKDKDLETIFSSYPFKYKLTKPGAPERELRIQGSLYVLCYVYTRGSVARDILGYDMTKPESAYASVTYPNGQPVLATYPSEDYVYKFYFKHIDSGNVFLGTKWDADVTWQQALKNHLMAFRAELKLN